jgi:alkaline phosphatase
VVVVAVLAACVSAVGVAPAGQAQEPAPRSVIFINGDGMAGVQREAGRLSGVGLDGDLAMDELPQAGLLATDSRDPKTFVTDSAAAATAWATGEKTYNGAISVDVNGNPLAVVGQQAKVGGKATGLVTTAQVTDASPAAFFSRTADRKQQDEIARQYLEETKPDVILGGGEDWWLPAGTPGAFPDVPPEDPEEASKGTKGDLVGRARELGYAYAGTPDQLKQASAPKLLGLFANEEMFQQKPEGQGDVYAPVVDLPTMTQKALDTLASNESGFFLFVEEEAVDEFAHQNNGAKMLQGMQQLDAAVAVARRYVAAHPETLLVVTGDHECGGLTVEGVEADDETGTGDPVEDGPFPIKGSDEQFVLDWTTTEHTDVPVPVTAEGPGAEALTGRHPNTYVHDVLTRTLGIRT